METYCAMDEKSATSSYAAYEWIKTRSISFTKHTSSNTLVVFLFTEDCLKVILPMKENCVLVWRIEAKKNQYGCLSSLCPLKEKLQNCIRI